uniref:Uncharacterized protein n=1 Tax=Anguilla anguilla TaxID=7936 RepID=A0A0E9W408_ANGAN
MNYCLITFSTFFTRVGLHLCSQFKPVYCTLAYFCNVRRVFTLKT